MYPCLFGFLILFNFAFVSEAIFDQNGTFQFIEKSTSSGLSNDDEDDTEYFEKTFGPLAIFTLEVFKLVGGFYNEYLNTTVMIKNKEIARLEEKIKQLEENKEIFEEKQTSAENLLETEALENTAEVYDEHEFQQFFYNKKMNKVIHLVKRKLELIKKMQNIKNEITVDKYMSGFEEVKEENYDIARGLFLKMINKQVPEVDFEKPARAVIDTINTILEDYRVQYNKGMAEKNEKISLLKQRIEEIQGNEATEDIENIINDEL